MLVDVGSRLATGVGPRQNSHSQNARQLEGGSNLAAKWMNSCPDRDVIFTSEKVTDAQ
jgi:hypothetical protein